MRFDHPTLHSIPSTFALDEEQGNPERGTESLSSTASRRLLPLRRGEDSTSSEANLRISTELTPYQNSSSFTLCCNPLDFGSLEYKDHQLLDVGTESARTRINHCVFSA